MGCVAPGGEKKEKRKKKKCIKIVAVGINVIYLDDLQNRKDVEFVSSFFTTRCDFLISIELNKGRCFSLKEN